jgi:ribA/ribD-fused uncharacterized protein
MKDDVLVTDRFVFFWSGWPSQWYKCRFEIDRVTFNCAEQYMMAEKARIFGDAQIEAKVLAATDPREQKALGRRVRNFDEARWNSVCREIVYAGNLAKFSQDERLAEVLLNTGHRTIVEASPTDAIWGIGLAKDHPDAQVPARWRGTNWLGVALMQVRDTIRAGRGLAIS